MEEYADVAKQVDKPTSFKGGEPALQQLIH